MRKFKSDGMIWDDGDIPHCSYCDKSIDDVYTLHETPYSGELICDDIVCRNSLLDNMLYKEVEEV